MATVPCIGDHNHHWKTNDDAHKHSASSTRLNFPPQITQPTSTPPFANRPACGVSPFPLRTRSLPLRDWPMPMRAHSLLYLAGAVASKHPITRHPHLDDRPSSPSYFSVATERQRRRIHLNLFFGVACIHLLSSTFDFFFDSSRVSADSFPSCERQSRWRTKCRKATKVRMLFLSVEPAVVN